MRSDELHLSYQELQRYLGWTEGDAQRVRSAARTVEPHFVSLIDDFYAEIERHSDAKKVITGGPEQVARLKGTLLAWLRDLFSGCYDRDFVSRRWNIGRRHVEIGLRQVYPDAALSRLRKGLVRALKKNCQDDSTRLAETVESLTMLSNFAKLPTPNLKPFEVAECIDDSLQNHPVPDIVQVSLDCPASLPKVEGDIEQIQIVFGNLIRNAREAMPGGGRLEIIARHEDSFVDIAFADNGVGIAPEDLNRIMEPLFSNKARGIGLGLAISRAILERNNGNLHVESKLGTGSTFTVQLKPTAT